MSVHRRKEFTVMRGYGVKCSSALKCVIVAMAVTIAVILLHRLVFPLYRTALERDLTLEIVATGQKNEDALGNNVRVRAIQVNDAAIDLGKIECNGNWDYAEADDYLYTYEVEEPDMQTVTLQNVISLEVSFVSEVGSGIVNLNINGQEWKQVDLYSSSDWSVVTYRYDTSPLVYAEEHIGLYLVVFLFAGSVTALLLWKLKGEKAAKLASCAAQFLLAAALAALICLNTYLIQFSSIGSVLSLLQNDYLVLLEGYILILLPLILLLLAFRRQWLAFSLVSLPVELMSLVSVEKIAARGSPLLPWDFIMIKEALSVAGGYDFSLPAVSVLVLVETLAVAAALFLERKRCLWARSGWSRNLAACAGTAALLLVFIGTTVYPGVWGYSSGTRVYQVEDYYESKGFIVAFAEYTSYLLPQTAPTGYSKDSVETLSSSIIQSADVESIAPESDAETLPNVIVIMSESFWDVTRLENVEFQEEPLPVLKRVKEESLYGNLLSHVFGGNTVVSEFEALTGLSASYFPEDYMVYGGFLYNGFPSAVSSLKSQGYRTLALHPYIATNYNRNVAYDCMGFDQCIFEEDFSEEDERARNYISDRALFERMEREYEALKEDDDAPVFMFAVTMQNHGGYWGTSLIENSQVSFTADGYDTETVKCMNDYFAGLHASDEALGELIEYFEEVEEETVLVFFGDHMSDAGTKAETMLSKESWYDTEEYEYQAHIVPFLIWNNKINVSEDMGLMEINRLLPTAFSRNGIEMPYFWKFLLASDDIYAAASKSLVVSSDLSVGLRSDMTEEQTKFWNEYQLLQYDHIWGQNYSEALW